MYICKNCGADMRFDAQRQLLVCDYCTSAITVQEYNAENAPDAVKADERELSPGEAQYYQNPEMPSGKEDYERIFASKEPESKQTQTWQAHICTCPQCGGQLLTYEETASTFCSFCGASVLLESRVSNEKRPDGIIPFSVSKEECEAAYRKLLKKSLFVPREMKKNEEIERFRGIYMPYWVYSFHSEGDVDVPGKRSVKRGDYIYTDHFSLKTRVKTEFDGISFDASSSFSDNLSEAIAPFDYKAAQDFDPGYISGFYADTNDVDSWVYYEEARSSASRYAADVVAASKDCRAYSVDAGVLASKINFEEEKPKLAFFPVWFLASRNKKQDRVSYAVVNGQTGKAAADLPIDKKKLLIGTLILAIPIFIFLNIVWTLTPKMLAAMTIALGIVALILANRQINIVYTFENRIADKGYQAVFNDAPQKVKEKKMHTAGQFGRIMLVVLCVIAMVIAQNFFGGIFSIVFLFLLIAIICKPNKKAGKTKEKEVIGSAPMKSKLGVLAKPLAGLIVAFIVITVNPVSDVYYYITCIIAMALVAWSFWEILSLRNRLCARPLPQFKKRGGESFEKY